MMGNKFQETRYYWTDKYSIPTFKKKNACGFRKSKWENMIKSRENKGKRDLKNLKLRSDVSNEILLNHLAGI